MDPYSNDNHANVSRGNILFINNLIRAKCQVSLIGILAAVALTGCGGGDSSITSGGMKDASLEMASVDNSGPVAPSARQASDLKKEDFAPDRVIVRFENSSTASNQKNLNAKSALGSLGFSILNEVDFGAGQTGAQKLSATSKGTEPPPHFAILSISDPSMSVQQAIERLQASKLVRYAEPDYRKKLHALPNDSGYGLQWHHLNTGLFISTPTGIVGRDLDSQQAWDLTTGSSASTAPVIAVIDCGFKLDHPDLANNWWVNPAPTFGDVNGADLGSNDGNPSPPAAFCTHGTNVAGVIGAQGNNTVGVAGVMWNTRIMALKTADETGALYVSKEILALNYAVARKNAGVNLKAINISLGGSTFVQAELDAVKAAGAADILVVASAGNDGLSNRNYPAAYDLPNIISVASTDRSDNLSSFSNYGSWVHIGAPGEQIYTTSFDSANNSNYTLAYGTSFSSPIVAGIAGLVANYLPGATMQQIRQRILSSAEPASGLAGAMQIPARANAYRALINQSSYLAPTTWTTNDDNLADQYVRNASYIVNAFIGVGASTTAVIAAFNGVDTPLRDDGQYPDKFAGDGHYTGIGKPSTSGAAVPISLRHVYTTSGGATASAVASGTIPVADAGNYQSSGATFAWSEPTSAPGAASIYTALADEGYRSVNLPFPITFYGLGNINTVKLTPNGIICIGAVNCSKLPSETYDYQPIPSNGARPHGLLAPWWSDWVVSGNAASNVFTHTEGTSPNRKFIITWKNAFPYADTVKTDGVSFQAQLYEGQNKFTFSYQDVSTNMAVSSTGRPDAGLLGSAGTQFFNGKVGTRTAYNLANSILASTNLNLTWGATYTDIPLTSAEAVHIEGLRGAYITQGCTTPNSFCNTQDVTRVQMAAFLARGTKGHDLLFNFPGVTPVVFSDVPSTTRNGQYVSTVVGSGIFSGCGGGAFCPATNMTRGAMAELLIKSVRGAAYVPPAAIGTFSDLAASDPLAPWVEELARMGITSGCGGANPTGYCPTGTLSRRQMSIFLQRTFRPWDY